MVGLEPTYVILFCFEVVFLDIQVGGACTEAQSAELLSARALRVVIKRMSLARGCRVDRRSAKRCEGRVHTCKAPQVPVQLQMACVLLQCCCLTPGAFHLIGLREASYTYDVHRHEADDARTSIIHAGHQARPCKLTSRRLPPAPARTNMRLPAYSRLTTAMPP